MEDIVRNKDCELSEELLRFQLQNMHTRHVGVDNIYWRSYGLFWATSGVLLVGLIAALPTEPMPAGASWVVRVAPKGLSAIGILQALAWFYIQIRIQNHVERFERLIHNLEGRHGLDLPKQFMISLWNHPDRENFSRQRARFLVPFTILIACAFWVMLFILV
jgi:hypothetical protein